ncbi:MAG TPA: hypothetical protein VGK19_18110 [Capsulimonadaceae bacterium]|jgi:hypothetical protein
MGTRSLIGRLNSDATVSSIYCHWDGYLSHNGAILHTQYQDADEVTALIALGNISSLGREIGDKHDLNRRHSDPSFELELSSKGWTSAYSRDRNEPLSDNKAEITASVQEYVATKPEMFGAEYLYLYDARKRHGQRWGVVEVGAKSNRLRPLRAAIIQELRTTPLAVNVLVGSPGKHLSKDCFAPVGTDAVEYSVRRRFNEFGEIEVNVTTTEIRVIVFGSEVIYPLTAKGGEIITKARQGTLAGSVIDDTRSYQPEYACYPIEDIRGVKAEVREKRARAKWDREHKKRARLRFADAA